jgi:hypothetical protein
VYFDIPSHAKIVSLLSNELAVAVVRVSEILLDREETIEMMSFMRFMEIIVFIFQI